MGIPIFSLLDVEAIANVLAAEARTMLICGLIAVSGLDAGGFCAGLGGVDQGSPSGSMDVMEAEL